MPSNNPTFQSVLPEYLVPKRGVGESGMVYNLRSVTFCYATFNHIYKFYIYIYMCVCVCVCVCVYIH